VEVLPGVRLLMLPGESLEVVVESLRNHFAETDSMFDCGWPLDAGELDEFLEKDPNNPTHLLNSEYVPFQSVPRSWGVRAEDREEWVGT